MKYIYFISAVSENTLRVLQRVAGIFARHRLNIEQLNVFETGNAGISHFSIVIHADPKTIARVMHQLQRIVELLEVKINNQIPFTEDV
jgi:acetolactate synthase-1/3 small subunit